MVAHLSAIWTRTRITNRGITHHSVCLMICRLQLLLHFQPKKSHDECCQLWDLCPRFIFHPICSKNTLKTQVKKKIYIYKCGLTGSDNYAAGMLTVVSTIRWCDKTARLVVSTCGGLFKAAVISAFSCFNVSRHCTGVQGIVQYDWEATRIQAFTCFFNKFFLHPFQSDPNQARLDRLG